MMAFAKPFSNVVRVLVLAVVASSVWLGGASVAQASEIVKCDYDFETRLFNCSAEGFGVGYGLPLISFDAAYKAAEKDARGKLDKLGGTCWNHETVTISEIDVGVYAEVEVRMSATCSS
ncbi:MAG: hypothetical protein AAGF95_09615 [Chloroflexota bacterium]